VAGDADSGIPEGSGRWSGRPFASRVLRLGIVAVPVAASFATAWTLNSVTAVPSTIAGAVVRWLLIAAAATVVLVAAERLTRRLAPLATLLALSLTFPDRAPPRFRVALRNGSTRQLHDRITEARRGELGGTPAEAAERVLELVAALSVHDRTTRGHSERVRAYSRMIGEEMGLDDVELDRLQWAGLLHDIGKLLIPAAILNKPDSLTAEEYEEVCLHPEYGRTMVTPLIPWLGDSARAVWEHHERWDGRGYPAGLAGVDIALAARIVAVADVFDVMTSARSYKKPVSSALARTELARCAGGQFDQMIVRAFLNISIGRLRLVIGPLSWLSQIPLFPTSVLSTAFGSHAATIAAVLTVVGPSAVGMEHVGASSVVGRAHRSVLESLGVTAELASPGRTVTTSVEQNEGQVREQLPPSTDTTSTIVPPTTPSTSSPPDPAVPIEPTPLLRVAPPELTPVVTPPTTSLPDVTLPQPTATQPTVPIVIQPTAPLVTLPPAPSAPLVDLGVAAGFAVLGYAAVTSTGPTLITGHVGTTISGNTGLTPAQVSGQIFATSPTAAIAAHAAVAAAQLFLDGLTASPLPGVELGGRTITPGVYQGGTIELTGTVILDAGGDPNALFVFKAASTLVTASASKVVLANGAQARNVFWQVGSSATFGTTTQFAGTVIANISITATTGVAVAGRLIARNGAVTLDSNTIEVPAGS
jgi:HD-GYP domain-containing protein (c-di-GMP phosphodiesterase class II)